MDTLIVVADLGCLKVYRVIPDEVNGSSSVSLVTEYKNGGAHERTSERVTDQAGRFPKGAVGGAGGMGYGENHNEKSETRKKLVENLGSRINAILKKEQGYSSWHFAAPKGIHKRLVDGLDAGIRGSLSKSLTLDLTKAGKKELLKRFE